MTGAQTGFYTYSTAAGAIDSGSSNYLPEGSIGNLNVTSISGAQANYVLDFATSQYIKTQNGRILETGSFSSEATEVTIPPSLSGKTISFLGDFRQTTQMSFAGLAGAGSGSYIATGSTADTGSYTYTINGVQGIVTVFSNVYVGSSANFALDFSRGYYTKMQNGSVLETGTFSY